MEITQNAIALVIGLCSHGIAMVRALKGAGVEVHALEAKKSLPGACTNDALVHYVRDINADSLIEDLLAYRQSMDKDRPIVLFPTNDNNVRIIAQHKHKLQPYFRLSWYDNAELILALLLKSNIEKRCQEAGIRYPNSMVLHTEQDVELAIARFEFPVLIKPVKPQSGFKALRCDTPEMLRAHIRRYHTELPILLQNWIAGTDKDLFFGALYLNRGNVVLRFCGNKLESHPPAMGQTTVAVSADNPQVMEITERFFAGLEMSGPVSLELKRDDQGRYWAIEPTVGRTDFWAGLCIAGGVNLLEAEFRHALGLNPASSATQRPAIWFDSEKDPLVVFRHLPRLLPPSRHRVWFSYFSATDPGPFWVASRRLVAKIPAYVEKHLGSARQAEETDAECRVLEYDGFETLPLECRDFLVSQAKGGIFTYDCWYENFCRTVAAREGRVRFLCLYRQRQLAAILPIWQRTEKLGLIRVSQVSSLGNYYTPLFSMSWVPGLISETAAGELFLQHLIERSGGWDLISLSPMPEQAVRRWQDACARLKLSCFPYFVTKNMYEDKVQGFAHYMKSRPSRLRNTIKRKTQKLDALGNWRMEIVTDTDQLGGALAAYHQVYDHSWKKAEPYPEFIDGLAYLGASRGWLRLGILYIGERPVAVQLWLVADDTACIYKLAYINEFKAYSPGTLLTHHLMRRVIEQDGVTKIDFLTGGEPFKLDWMTSYRNLHGIQIVNRRRLVGFFYFLWNTAGRLRKALSKSYVVERPSPGV